VLVHGDQTTLSSSPQLSLKNMRKLALCAFTSGAAPRNTAVAMAL